MNTVAPRVGAWIETNPKNKLFRKIMSHPVWVRGLKLSSHCRFVPITMVAPRVGAWIETVCLLPFHRLYQVAPRVGAWIETRLTYRPVVSSLVAPRVGAWIETTGAKYLL